MTISSAITILLFALASAVVCFAQPDQISALEPGLRDALVRDASCASESAPRIADDPAAQFLQSHVKLQTFRGAHPGSIVVLDGACHCSERGSERGSTNGSTSGAESGAEAGSQAANCATYVYLRSGESYRLALHGVFASLRPLSKGLRHGMPSLTARFEAGDSKAETVIFEWSGKEYQPTLCASIVESGKRRLAISKHACAASPALAAQ
ncbi:MAG: hypothetical protein ACLPLR_16780 [Terriglobales bacterium]